MTLYRSETPLSKREALRHCELRNETLATIDSVTADSVLSTRIPAQEEAWIGLNINPTIGRQWKWLHGKRNAAQLCHSMTGGSD